MTDFSPNSLRRISRSVNFTERITGRPPKIGKGRGYNGDGGKLAKITGKSGNKYSWVAMKPDDGELVQDQDWGEGSTTENYAVSTDGSEYVLEDSIVRLYPALTGDYYLFDYQPGLALGKTTETITARDGSTAGSGSVKIQTADDTTLADGETIEVLNSMPSEIDEDKIVQLSYVSGRWFITGVEC